MGIFARGVVKAFDQGAGTLAAGAHILQMGGGRSVTGLSITTERALRFAAFRSAVHVLSEDVAKLPLGVFRRREDGGAEPQPTHPVERVIRYKANPQTSAFTAREVSMVHLLTWGNCYSFKLRDSQFALRALWLASPDRMEVERLTASAEAFGRGDGVGFEAGDLRYRYVSTSGQTRDFTQGEVFHIPGLSWDGVRGYSVISQARESIGLGLAAEEHGARFFGQGATAPFALATDKPLSDGAYRRLRSQIKTEHTGLSNAWEPWLLEEGLKPHTLSIPNDDAQWLETRKLQVTEIARWFRLPPHKIGDMERATFSNVEHLALEYVTDALMGWLTRWEAAIGMQLLGSEWIGAGGDFYVKFNVNALLRGDFATRMAGYSTGRQGGWLTPNMILGLEDMNPVEHGDTLLRPLNMVDESAFDENGMTLGDRVGAAGVLVRAGYDPAAVLAAMQLPEIPHTGLVPITVQVDPSALSPQPSRNGVTP